MDHYDLVDIRLFSHLANELNLTRASAKLGIAPSSASVRLRDFEEALGVKLVIRKARGIELTRAGELVNRRCKRIIAELGGMANDLAPFVGGAEEMLRIAGNYGAIMDYLPSDAASFIARNPDVRIALKHYASHEVLESVIAGHADVGVASFEGNFSGLEMMPYREDRLVVVCRKDSHLAMLREAEFRKFLDCDFITLPSDSAMQRYVFDHALQYGVRIQPRMQADSQGTLVSLVRMGVGIGVVSRQAFCQFGGDDLCAVEIAESWALRHLKMVWSRDGWKNKPMVRAFIEFVKSESQSLQGG